MKVKLFAVCDSAVVDQRTNNVSMFSVFSMLTPDTFPFVLPRITVVGVFESGDDDKAVDVDVRIKQGTEVLFAQSFSWVFEEKRGHRNIFELYGLVIPEPKELVFQVLRNSRQIATYTIHVRENPAANEIPIVKEIPA